MSRYYRHNPDEPIRHSWITGGQLSSFKPKKTILADDIARCDGVGNDQAGWREGCEDCLRRTAPRPEMTTHMEPPAIIAFECEWRIEP